jgi:type II secretory pathway component PulF
MPKYQYKAIDAAGKIRRGSVVSLTAEDVESTLADKQLTMIWCKPLKEGVRSRIESAGRIKPRLLIEFYHRLSQTLEMGLPLIAALEENAKILPSKYFCRVITEVKIAIEGGRTLHESMSRYPKVFDKLELSIIRMGEQTGVLPKSMKDLADFLEWKEDIRSTVKRATIYPSFVMLVIVAVIGVWVGYVLPQMAVLLTEMGVAAAGRDPGRAFGQQVYPGVLAGHAHRGRFWGGAPSMWSRRRNRGGPGAPSASQNPHHR